MITEEMTVDLQLLRRFRRCAHLLHHRKSRYQGQGRILVILFERGFMTQRDLLDLTEIRSASLSELLEKLEKNGYITRSKNDVDRRNVDIVLTEEGKQAAREAKQERQETAELLFSTLNPTEKAALSEILTKLSSYWEQECISSEEQAKQDGCDEK